MLNAVLTQLVTVSSMNCGCGRPVRGNDLVCRRCSKKLRKGESLDIFPDTFTVPVNPSTTQARTEPASDRTRGQRAVARSNRATLSGALVGALAFASALHIFFPGLQAPSVTWAALLVTVVSSARVFKEKVDPSEIWLDSDAVNEGEKLRLLTVSLIHGDALHLMFNSLALWSFGRAVEQIFLARYGTVGGSLYALFYLAACITSSYLSVLIANRQGRKHLSVGASGGILVLVSFVAVLYPTATFLLLFIPMPAWVFLGLFVAVSVYAARKRDSRVDAVMTFGQGRVDHVGHLTGVAVGALAALLFR